MLKLDLAAVSRGEERAQGEIPPDDPLWNGTGVELAEPLRADLRAHALGGGVLVRGTLGTTLKLECRRCVAPVEQEVDERVELLFESLNGREAEELSGDVYPLPERGTELDLGEPIREQLLLRVPMYVVCKEECRGLCPQCGVNLGQTTCTCVPEQNSSPWDTLKTIEFD